MIFTLPALMTASGFFLDKLFYLSQKAFENAVRRFVNSNCWHKFRVSNGFEDTSV